MVLKPHSVVMPGFRPGIHEFANTKKLVDAKAKPWHDGENEPHRFRCLP